MLCNRNIQYILIALLLPLQYPFQTDFFTSALPLMQSEWTKSKVPNIQILFARYIISVSTLFCSIISTFIYHKIKKRRLALSIVFIINSIIFFLYLLVNEDRFWVTIILRAFHGFFLGFFHSISVSILYLFSGNIYPGFFGCLIQTVMFLGLVFLGLLFSALHWKYIAIILGVECLLCSALIWILPEMYAPPKHITRDYIYNRNHCYSIFVIFMLMLLQQFSGIGIVINNVPAMLEGIGLSIETHLQTALMNTIGCFTTFIGAFASVIVQRKYMWGISAFGLTIALLIYTITLKADVPQWVGTLGVFLFFMFYGFGEGPITWFLSGELFPDSVRIESGAITIFLNQALGLIFTFVNDEIKKAAGEFGAIIFSAVMDFVAMFFGLMFIPTSRMREYANDNLL